MTGDRTRLTQLDLHEGANHQIGNLGVVTGDSPFGPASSPFVQVTGPDTAVGRPRQGRWLYGGYVAESGQGTSEPARPTEVIARFAKPPVAEVVAAVGFADLQTINFLSVGELWRQEYAEDFPEIDVQPPYEAPKETFGAAPGSRINVELTSTPPLPRLWLKTGQGQQLLQVQNNWFAANWRKVQSDDKYGHWPERRVAFSRNWERFSSWMRARNEILKPNQCEVTYINHIEPIPGLWKEHGEAWKVFHDAPRLSAGLDLDGMTWQAHYLLRGPTPGRLHVSVQPALRNSDLLPLLVMEVTARCEPIGLQDSDILATLDVCRDAVVHAFVDLTPPQAKEAWGLER